MAQAARTHITGTFADSPLAEQEYLVGAIAAQSLDRFGLPTDQEIDFFDAKGILEAVFTVNVLGTYDSRRPLRAHKGP